MRVFRIVPRGLDFVTLLYPTTILEIGENGLVVPCSGRDFRGPLATDNAIREIIRIVGDVWIEDLRPGRESCSGTEFLRYSA
jgi:hypothetical protein